MKVEVIKNKRDSGLSLDEARYLDFPSLLNGHSKDEKPGLNRYSSIVTNGVDFPGAQVLQLRLCLLSQSQSSLLQQAMLYAAGVPDRKTMQTSAQVGIASVWWEGNPCKYG